MPFVYLQKHFCCKSTYDYAAFFKRLCKFADNKFCIKKTPWQTLIVKLGFHKGVFMKETGMTRRVDELGRVVIPKEIRQIFKIKVGTPLEIFIEGDRLIMQKYSVAQGNAVALCDMTDSLAAATGLTAVSFNNEKAICARGKDAAEFADTAVCDEFFERLAQRQPFDCNAQDYFNLQDRTAYVFPLVHKGDLLGATAVLSVGEIDTTDKKLTRLACDLFLKQLD